MLGIRTTYRVLFVKEDRDFVIQRFNATMAKFAELDRKATHHMKLLGRRVLFNTILGFDAKHQPLTLSQRFDNFKTRSKSDDVGTFKLLAAFLMGESQNLRQLFKSRVNAATECVSTYMSAKITAKAADFFTSKPLNDQWLGWLGRAFQNPQTHDALLALLLHAITEKSFVASSADYGLNLLTHAISQKSVLDASANLVLANVRDTRVQQAGAGVCSYLVQQPESLKLSSEIMTKVCLRREVMDVALWQINCGFRDAFDGLDGKTIV